MPSWWSALTSPPKGNRPPPRKVLWTRAIPIFIVMMAVLFGAQYELAPRFPGNFLFANGSLGLALIAGLVGAIAIGRFGMEQQPKKRADNRGPGMSKTQRRKLERAARLAAQPQEPEEPEPVMTVRASTVRPRHRRRRH